MCSCSGVSATTREWCCLSFLKEGLRELWQVQHLEVAGGQETPGMVWVLVSGELTSRTVALRRSIWPINCGQFEA